jgi:hypothetical protein
LNSVKRWGAFAVAVAAIVMGIAQPAAAEVSDACDGASCGKPRCGYPNVRVRPARVRALTVTCIGMTGARLIRQPEHGSISGVTTDFYGLHFDARADEGAPRFDTALFEVDGQEESIELEVQIEVLPDSENSAPSCWGEPVAQRSDGAAPVEVSPWVSCWDPDGDELLIEGSGPGTHLELPKQVPAGETGYSGRYRTATSAGTETTTVWATDVLGLRSEDEQLEVTVGPDVDRPPECAPSWYSTEAGYLPIYTRPGRIRRFGIVCNDPDEDLFEPVMSTPPSRGALVPVVSPPYTGLWSERWVDATYTPADDGVEPDRFAFQGVGAHGAGPPGQLAMVPKPLPENFGGGCGWSPANIVTNVPGTVLLSCDDREGDPLSVEVLTEPRHGVRAEPVVRPWKYGSNIIEIPYVPAPGYEGYDCVKVRVTDGHGSEMNVAVDIWVAPPRPGQDGAGPYVPPVPPLPPLLPPLPAPPSLPQPPLNRENARVLAQRALGTSSVKRVRRQDGAEVWARSNLSKAELLRRGRAPGLAVICLVDCRIRSDSTLAGVRSLKATRHKAAAAKTAGQAHIVSLDLTRPEQRALRRARRPRATFNLNVRAAGGRARALHRSIPIGR